MEHNDNEQQFTPGPDRYNGYSSSGGNPNAPAPFVAHTLARLGLPRAKGSPIMQNDQLRVALNDPAWSVRIAAVQAIESKGEQAPIELLLSALKDENSSVRAAAARVLGRLGEYAPVEPLVAALQDNEWYVRATSAQALGKLPDRAPVAALVEALQDEDESVRAAAAWALGEAGERAPLEPLMIALDDPAWSVREAAVLALGELEASVQLTPMQTARTDEDILVREPTSRSPIIHFVEKVLVALVLVGLVVGWLLLARVPRATTSGPRAMPTPLIYHSYTGAIYGGVYKVAWSPDGTEIASVNVDGSVRVWNAMSGKTITSYTSPVNFVSVLSMVWLPGGNLLILSKRADNSIDAWNATTGKVSLSMKLPATIYTGAWSPDGERIAFDDGNQAIQVWNVFPTKKRLSVYAVHSSERITALAWSTDSTEIASALYNGVIELWNAATAKNVSQPYSHAGQTIALSWSRNSSYLAWATSDGSVQIRNKNLRTTPITLRNSSGTIMPTVALSWSPDSAYLAASNNQFVQVWNVTTRKLVFTYRGHSDGVNDLAWSPDGSRVASASLDGTVQVWGIS